MSGEASSHKAEFDAAITELVNMIESAQQPDGYLNIYFTVVDPAGRLKNLRDMHEMYNAGHLLEAALAHYQYTGSRQFLDVMIRNVEFFMKEVGPNEGQIHGYPGHPELELALFRLYAVTRDQRHLEYVRYLLNERGVSRPEYDNFYHHEAKLRDDILNNKVEYQQAHKPIVDQENILGHSVRAFYLLVAAADAGGQLQVAARRLFDQAVRGKMYVTGGFGSEPSFEGFHEYEHVLPQSTAEGGCYAETCASIAAMMTAERFLADKLDGSVRDTLELAFLNAALGGASLDAKAFSYANKMATCCDETAFRKEWFEVCCCPPNLSRTLGLLGGYTWSANVDADNKSISLNVLLLLSATRTIPLGDGVTATVTMKSGMPFQGHTTFEFAAPEGWSWDLHLPSPGYATDVTVSVPTTADNGFLAATLPATASVSLDFNLPVRILASNPAAHDLLTVTRGPIVYVAESVDNVALDERFPHFEAVGLTTTATFTESEETLEGVTVTLLTSASGDFKHLDRWDLNQGYTVAKPATWSPVEDKVTLVPWFARANRGGAGRLRTSFARAA